MKGVHSLVWDEAQKLAGKDADFNRRDMFESIERGDFLEWELGIQVVDEKDEFAFDFDLLDDTKLIPEELVPVKLVGKLTLNRNPDNYFAETEQVAFCVSHVVPGIDFTNDPMLQGRLMSYLDTQLRRIGPNFAELPINRPLNPVSNNRRDGFAKNTINKGRVSYFPSALAGVHPMQQPDAVDAFRSYAERVDGHKVRGRSKSFTDYFTQATLFWNSMAPWEKDHIAAGFSFEFNQCETKGRAQGRDGQHPGQHPPRPRGTRGRADRARHRGLQGDRTEAARGGHRRPGHHAERDQEGFGLAGAVDGQDHQGHQGTQDRHPGGRGRRRRPSRRLEVRARGPGCRGRSDLGTGRHRHVQPREDRQGRSPGAERAFGHL